MIRKRYYYYPSPLAVDKFNTRVLRALSTKLSRDYLGFFGSLSKLYTKGEQKKKLNSVVGRVRKSITLLDNMISAAKVSEDDVENLLADVEEINKSRDYFLAQAEQNRSLEGKIQKATEATGVSPQDLNITKEIIRKGAAQVRRRTREGAAPFLKRTMPGTIGLGAELGKGALAAALGPFAPIAGMAGTILKGIAGVGAGIREKRQLRREEKLAGRIAPMAQGFEPSVFERLRAKRAGQPLAAGFGGVARRTPFRRQSKEEMVFPLTYFFDKKAHKAKWTKEVLSRFKKLEKGISRTRDGGLFKGLFGRLTAGISPLVRNLALLTAGVGASAVSFVKIKQAWDAFTGYRGAKKELEESKKVMRAVAGTGPGTWEHELLTQEDPIAALKRYKKEGRIAPQIASVLEKRMTPGYVKAHKKAAQWTKESEEAKLLTERISGGMVTRESLLEALPTTTRSPFPPGGNEEVKQGMLGVQKAVEKVNDTISRQQGPAVKGASLGDPFGTGDPLMLGWSTGELSIGSD